MNREPDYRFKVNDEVLGRVPAAPLDKARRDLADHTLEWRASSDFMRMQQCYEGWWKPGCEREGSSALGALFAVLFPDRFPKRTPATKDADE